MLREVHRTVDALAASGGEPPARGGAAAGSGEAARRGRPGPPISRTRAVVQIVLTILLVPLCVWALFIAPGLDATARSAAGAVLGAIVTFWLKD